MKKYRIIAAAVAVATLFSCSKSEAPVEEPADEPVENSETLDPCLVPGEMIVQVSEEMADMIEKAGGNVPETKAPGLTAALKSMGATSFRRMYEDAGEWEPRHREAGLHRWYRISYDPTLPQTKASVSIENVSGVVYVEPVRVVKSLSIPKIFNDPKLSQQWQYYNDGSAGSKYVSGSDINVVPVWTNYTGGSSNVIVCVEDVGVDLSHEDLADICIPGGPNGSKCFVSGYVGYKIYPANHATHVAGTIAAINNNGKGVCGIAGGLDGKGGVRIMSTPIMMADPSDATKTLQGDDAAAMVWAADHGAVISQNSWGYSYSSAEDAKKGDVGAVKTAIDYFVKYAGLDKDGNQTGPMAGGVVFFAAGNDGWPNGWPAEYDGCIAVGAVSSMLSRSYYSNYGDWVDICAPGGDSKLGPQILSCIADNGYSTMQGTSMACPHVSGVAALIVSQFGGPGFTNDMLLERLLKGANTTKIPSAYKIGPLVDALGSFTYGGEVPPEQVKEFTATSASNNITLNWNVTADPDDVTPHHYLLVLSKDESSVASYSPKATASSGVTLVSVSVDGKKLGEAMSSTFSSLEFDTTYYVGIMAVDYSNNCSAMSEVKSVKTGVNNPPVITAKASYDNPVQVRAHQTISIEFTVSDPDGHSYSYSFTPGSDAAAWSTGVEDNEFKMSFVGKNAPAGSYVANITVTDAFGAKTSLDVPYVIHVNHAPAITGSVDNKIFTKVGETAEVDLNSIFSDEDGERLSFVTESDNAAVVHAYESEGKLTLTTLGYGSATVSLKASDTCGESVSTTFSVVVRDPSLGPDFSISNGILSISTYYDGTVTVVVTNAAGAKIYAKDLASKVFTPIQLDLSACAPGVYGVSATYEGNTWSSKIVKK